MAKEERIALRLTSVELDMINYLVSWLDQPSMSDLIRMLVRDEYEYQKEIRDNSHPADA
jgi:hypothetical protein